MHEGLTKVVGACLPIYILVRLRGKEEGEGGIVPLGGSQWPG
jgi:hypothetical protein